MNKINLQLFAEEFAGLLSKGTVLAYKKGEELTEIAGVKSVPAIGSDPEKVDVTDLQSDKKKYIKGLQDVDNLEFSVVYKGKNFADYKTLVDAGEEVDWVITYPDGMKVEFRGEPDVKLDGVEVNAAIGFSIVIVVSDGPTITAKK